MRGIIKIGTNDMATYESKNTVDSKSPQADDIQVANQAEPITIAKEDPVFSK